MKVILIIFSSLVYGTFAFAIPEIHAEGGSVTIPFPYLPKQNNKCSDVTAWASSYCKTSLSQCENDAAIYRTLNSQGVTVSTQCISAYGTGQCSNSGLILQTSIQVRP